MNGGKLVQDVNHHGIFGFHKIKRIDKNDKYNLPKIIEITSTHHQMQYPYCIDDNYYDVLYVSEPNRSDYYLGGGIDSNKIKSLGEPEIVLYHTPNSPVCLGIQGHPEMMENDSLCVITLNNLIENLLNNK